MAERKTPAITRRKWIAAPKTKPLDRSGNSIEPARISTINKMAAISVWKAERRNQLKSRMPVISERVILINGARRR